MRKTSSEEFLLFHISRLLKVLINAVTCSVIDCGNFSAAVDEKVTLLVPTADKSNVDVKMW